MRPRRPAVFHRRRSRVKGRASDRERPLGTAWLEGGHVKHQGDKPSHTPRNSICIDFVQVNRRLSTPLYRFLAFSFAARTVVARTSPRKQAALIADAAPGAGACHSLCRALLGTRQASSRSPTSRAGAPTGPTHPPSAPARRPLPPPCGRGLRPVGTASSGPRSRRRR